MDVLTVNSRSAIVVVSDLYENVLAAIVRCVSWSCVDVSAAIVRRVPWSCVDCVGRRHWLDVLAVIGGCVSCDRRMCSMSLFCHY